MRITDLGRLDRTGRDYAALGQGTWNMGDHARTRADVLHSNALSPRTLGLFSPHSLHAALEASFLSASGTLPIYPPSRPQTG